MSDVTYKYYGVLTGDRTPDLPAGVIRVWTDADGRQQEQMFTSDLTWERSYEMSSNSRPTYDRIVEIDEVVVDKFIERVTKKILDRRNRSEA